ncbi:MAG: hypothetical protein JRI23_12070 [Deltaproteobacteria bacterium]|jgi:chromosome segregation ATPase|nr:hypothetical protein [Deltaproteobacteria bacterium]MBW2532445.1 hypothetical protein [Deltaproteobacteria bacterium]
MAARQKWLGHVVACCALCLCTQSLGCGESTPQPEIASAATLAGYAQGYPDEVDAAVRAFGEAEVAAKDLSAGFGAYPGEYEDEKMDYRRAADLFERAGQVGRSRAYYERLGEVRSVRTFYAEEKEDIRRKVAGAAQHTAQQAGCNAEVGGAAAVTLDKMIDEKLEERLRERNDAHRMLERDEDAIGKKNVAALEKQIDEVTLSSYLVHIAMVEEKVRLERLIGEASQIKETADEAVEAEHRYQEEPGRTDEEKQAASERIEAMKTAKGKVDTAVRNAEKTLEKLDQRIEQARKTQGDALQKLVEQLRKHEPKS